MTIARYSNAIILLHWMTLALIVLSLCIVLYRSYVLIPANDPSHVAYMSMHMSIGVLIWVLTVARLVIRFTGDIPEPINSNPLFALVERGVHYILYANLFFLPLIGLTAAWIRGRPFVFFGVFTVPSPLATDWASPTGKWLDSVHKEAAYIFLAIVALHSLAALYHYKVRGTEISPRMQIDARRK